MPKYKFGLDDIFVNYVKTYPQYEIDFYFNTASINSRISEGNVLNGGTLDLFEMNVNALPTPSIDANTTFTQGNLIKQFVVPSENQSDVLFNSIACSSSVSPEFGGGYLTGSSKQIDIYKYLKAKKADSSAPIYLNTIVSASIHKHTYLVSSSNFVNPYDITVDSAAAARNGFRLIEDFNSELDVKKLLALRNAINNYALKSTEFDYNKHFVSTDSIEYYHHRQSDIDPAPVQIIGSEANVAVHPTKSADPRNNFTSMLEIPKIFYDRRIKPGSVKLEFFVTGTLLAVAEDQKQNGLLYETTGANTGEMIGNVLYDHGIMLITGAYSLDDGFQEGYLSPVSGAHSAVFADWVDRPRWVHFGKYRSYISITDGPALRYYAPYSSSYRMTFKGESLVPTMTMFATAPKNHLNWSNNPTYIRRSTFGIGADVDTYGEMLVTQTGSQAYIEGDEVPVANTISSSFVGYSASYKDQTFISKIKLFDEDGEVIAIAKLSTPIVKKAEQDYTFKLKLDL